MQIFFYRLDALPVTQPTVSWYYRGFRALTAAKKITNWPHCPFLVYQLREEYL